MAEGLGRERWAHTSILCALIANANRDPKRGRPLKPSDFDPYLRRDRRQRINVDKNSLKLLKAALTGQKGSAS